MTTDTRKEGIRNNPIPDTSFLSIVENVQDVVHYNGMFFWSSIYFLEMKLDIFITKIVIKCNGRSLNFQEK